MNELFEQEGRSIFSFKKGDIIIKVKPRIIKENRENENLGISIEIETGVDNSFRIPCEFIGIENNLIYLKYLTGYFKGKITTGYLDFYSEGWELFRIPDGLKIEDAFN